MPESTTQNSKRDPHARTPSSSQVAEQIVSDVPTLPEGEEPAPGVTPLAVRTLIHTAFLNLSLCFLKTNEYQHARNCATRAMEGDKEPK